MGFWGPNILDNDDALNLYSPYVENFESGIPIEDIKKQLKKLLYQNTEPVLGDNTAAWLGYAQAQLKTNTVEQGVVEIVKEILDQGIDDDYWEYDPVLLSERKKAIQELYDQLKEKLNC